MADRTTSAHVASVAGVSRATVSYVLNNRTDKQISESTRRLVLDAAKQLNYSPSPAARALRRGTGDVVVALVPGTWDTSEPIARLLANVGSAVSSQGLAFMRYQIGAKPGYVQNLLHSVTAACVVTFQRLSAIDQAALDAMGVKEIRAWILQSSESSDTIRIGQRKIVRTQVEHLMGIGCERLVYVAEDDASDDDFVRARVDAFGSLASAAGVEHTTVTYLSSDTALATDAVLSWIDGDTRVGVCAFSDVVAARVLATARNAGVCVPRQLSVIGVDDSPFTSFLVPPLSTVGYDLAGEAHFIAADIFTALERTPARRRGGAHETVFLIRREST